MKATRNIAAVFVVLLVIIGTAGFLIINHQKNIIRFSEMPSPSVRPTLKSSTLPMVSQVKIYLVALNDEGKTGMKIGCGDSLVPVTLETSPTHAPLKATLKKLFSIKQQYYGQPGLYNSLYQSNLSIQSLSIDQSGVAHIQLTGTPQLGGECDNPRFKAQIEQTILQFSAVKSLDVTINGEPLDQIVKAK